MHGPLLFLSVFPVHQTQWGLMGHYCRAAGRSHSNVPISSESHYTMVCLLTINFPTNYCLEIFIIFVGKHFSLFPLSLPPPLLSFLPQPPLLVPPPASTPMIHVLSLFTFSFPLHFSPSFSSLLPTDITILSLSLVPKEANGYFAASSAFYHTVIFP